MKEKGPGVWTLGDGLGEEEGSDVQSKRGIGSKSRSIAQTTQDGCHVHINPPTKMLSEALWVMG